MIKIPSPLKKRKSFRSKFYREYVSHYRCAVCGGFNEVDKLGNERCIPCHLDVGQKGASQKSHDLCYPGCGMCHQMEHDFGRALARTDRLEGALRVTGDFMADLQEEIQSYFKGPNCSGGLIIERLGGLKEFLKQIGRIE